MSTAAQPYTYAPPVPAPDAPIAVRRWPAETPLLVITAWFALSMWVVLAVSVIGLVYVALIAAFFFVAHLAFVAHLRANAVRVGPDQLPELHARVTALAQRMGIRREPEVYVLQAGGTLNALATRFLRAQFVVLFSELLEACGDDEAARDMIIAHELGHLRAGHLRWHWLLLPGFFVPFLGAALSRAREYTADRYGLAGAGDRAGAVRGLTLLAAGPVLARRVDAAAFVRQHRALDTGWMRLGEWLMSHPPLPRRIAQLDPALGAAPPARGATVRALGIVGAVTVLPLVVGIGVAAMIPQVREAFKTAAVIATPPGTEEMASRAFDAQMAQADFRRLAAVLDGERAAGRPLPDDHEGLAAAWERAHPDEGLPLDPADGMPYLYERRDDGSYVLTSSGPDAEAGTADDLRYESAAARATTAAGSDSATSR